MAPAIVLLVFNVLASCSGLFFNTFIAVISCKTCLRNGFQNPRDLLLLSIGLSGVFFESFQFFSNMAAYIWTDVFSTYNICIACMNLVYSMTIFSSSCLTSFLCSFYCIRLVTFQHWIITQMRSIFPSLLQWMVAGTFVIFSIFLVALVTVICITAPILDDGSLFHCPPINETYNAKLQAIMAGINFMIALPFLLIVVSLGATLTSLSLYIWKFQNASRLDRSHLTAHSDAAKTMLLLLGLNVLFYISQLLLIGNVVARSSPMRILCIIMFLSFWTLQALTLIVRTKKFSFRMSALLSALKMLWTKDIYLNK